MRWLLIKMLLSPILLIQGLYVRKTIVKLPEPNGPRSGRCGSGPELNLLILGDSAAAGVGVELQEQALSGSVTKSLKDSFSVNWHLVAQTGETTESIVHLLSQSTLDACDVVLISLGVNDTTSGKSVRIFEQHTLALINLLQNTLNPSQIIFSSLPPMGEFPALPNPLRWFLGRQSQALDLTLQSLAQENTCHYLKLDLAPDPNFIAEDGFHPGPKVYAAWGEQAAQLIKHHKHIDT